MAFALVFGATAFNLFLCFVNTNVTGVSNMHVIACEVVIISLVLIVSYRTMEQHHLLLMGAITLWALSLAAVRVIAGTDDGIDVKIVRDLVIPVAFFLLGAHVRNLKTADFVVAASAAAVLALALFEYFWLETFTKLFSISKYYIARGTMEAHQALQSADLFISGMRPTGGEQGGRNLLPFLGEHRVSSVFLEPVSLGNFGVLIFIWGLLRSKFERTLYLGIMAAGLTLIVLADSRFGAYLCIIALVVMLTPINVATLGLMALPLVAVVVLVLVPVFVTGSFEPQTRHVDNGFVGRFVLSGQFLSEFDVATWFGLRALRMQAFDSGYAYVISGIGVIGLAAAWLLFFSIKTGDRQFYTFRNMTAVYYATILCVSNSPFTIKTAGLLWFLVGTLAGCASRQDSHPPMSAQMRRPLPLPDHGSWR